MKKIAAFFLLFFTLVFLVWRALLIIYLPAQDLVTLTTDDAFYYMNIASNITQGHGATFDGINKTNGFHPLWQIMLIPVYWLIPSDRVLALRIVLFIQLLVFTLILFLLLGFVQRKYTSLAAFPVLIIFLFSGFANRFIEGMETPIQLIILTILIMYMNEKWLTKPALKKDIVLGSLIGLLTLARLDSALFLVACLLYLFIQTLLRRSTFISFVQRSINITLPAIFLIAPFLIWNKINFNHFSTISSKLKSTFPQIAFDPAIIARYKQWSALAIFTGLFFIFFVFSRFDKFGKKNLPELPRPYFITTSIYCVYILLHFTFMLLFSRWEIAGWYFTPYLLIIPLSIGPIILTVKKIMPLHFLKPAPLTYLVLITAGFTFDAYMQYFSLRYRLKGYTAEFYRPSYFTALWAKKNTPQEAIFASTDCGIFGYFSERKVIELDGVVNNFEYQEWLLDKGLKDYLKNKGVNYIRDYASLVPETYEYFQYAVRSKIKRDYYENLSLPRINEVYRSPAYTYLGKKASQIIWEFKS